MRTFVINFYPDGLRADEGEPTAYAYPGKAGLYPPTLDGYQFEVTIPDSKPTVRFVKP